MAPLTITLGTKINDEAIASLWDGLRIELEALTAPEGVSESVLNCLRIHLFGVLGHFAHDVIECVAHPTTGADARLDIVLNADIKRHLTLVAQDLMARFGHRNSPDDSLPNVTQPTVAKPDPH